MVQKTSNWRRACILSHMQTTYQQQQISTAFFSHQKSSNQSLVICCSKGLEEREVRRASPNPTAVLEISEMKVPVEFEFGRSFQWGGRG